MQLKTLQGQNLLLNPTLLSMFDLNNSTNATKVKQDGTRATKELEKLLGAPKTCLKHLTGKSWVSMKGASLKGSVIHKQGRGEVHYFVKNISA